MLGKLLALLLAVAGAACSNSTATTSSCPQTIAQRCARGDPLPEEFGVHCALTLAAAEQDLAVCMDANVNEATCGTLTVITVTNVDFSYLYSYDASGALIAITSDGIVGGQQCVAGPSTFAIPHAACTETHPLAVCFPDAGAAD